MTTHVVVDGVRYVPGTICECCGQPGDLIQLMRFDGSEPWFCRDTVTCYARDWPEVIEVVADATPERGAR